MAVVAGTASLGKLSIMDYIASSSVPISRKMDEQEQLISDFAEGIAGLRAAYWKQTKVPDTDWPATVVMMAVASPSSYEPMVWRLVFTTEHATIERILQTPNIYLEGSSAEAFSLLYGHSIDVANALGAALIVNGQAVGEDAIYQALRQIKILKPIDKLSLDFMPIQDAIDLATFIANTQVQMERFLPGEPFCGGPIDIMVLKTALAREILWLPGKTIHHPGVERRSRHA
jgi:hypothetical protein